MKNKNVYFVGYFLEKEEKLRFANLIEDRNIYFLESSYKKVKKEKNKNIYYFPEILHKIKVRMFNVNYENLVIDRLLVRLYKMDFRHFNSSKGNRSSKIRRIKSYIRYMFTELYKSNFSSSFNFKDKKKKIVLFDKLLRLNFRRKFLKGYCYTINLLDNLTLNKDDIFIIWGKSYSSRTLLIHYLEERNIQYYIAEYGEVPGTISCSSDGIFGETFSVDSWDELLKLDISKEDKEYANNILQEVEKKKLSTRVSKNNMFFMMKYSIENLMKRKDTQKIIYVNGAELFSSGLFDNRWGVNTKGQNPNKYLLQQVEEYFNSEDYMIIYKEHPMTLDKNKNLLLKQSDFPTVVFLNDVGIDDVLSVTDLVITYPSKVVMTALLHKKTTFVLGDFTIPYSVPSMNYFTSKIFGDIGEIEEKEVTEVSDEYIDIVARLIKYVLIVYDDTLYYKFDRLVEQKKFLNIMNYNLKK